MDLSSTTLSQLSEVAHLTSHILGPAFRALLVSLGRTQQQFHYSLCRLQLASVVSSAVCCLLSAPSAAQPSSAISASDILLHSGCPHAPASKAPVLPNAPSVTFPVPFRSFHAPLTHSWDTLPDSLPFSLHHSTATLSLLPRCHPSVPQPPSAQSHRPAAPLLYPSLLAATTPQTLSSLTSPTCSGLSIGVDVPSGAPCPRTYKPSSFQSALISLGFVSQASSALGPPSWQFTLEPLRAIPAQRHDSGALMPTSTFSLSAWSWVLFLHV